MTETGKKKAFDVNDLLQVAWRRKWLIIIPMILVTAATFAGSYLITPEYESSVIVWTGSPVKLSNDLQRLLGSGQQMMRTDRDRQMELKSLQNEITSTPYLGQLVAMLKLDQDPKLNEKAAKARVSRPDLSLDQIKLDFLVNSLREKIGVGYAGNDQVQITVHSPDPNLARDMAQNLGDIFITEKMRQELGSVRISQDFSFEQLSRYERDLQDKIDRKTALERQYLQIQLNESVMSDENRRAINAEIAATNLEIRSKNEEEKDVISQLADLGLTKSKLVLEESNKLTRLKEDIKQLIGSIATLMQNHEWKAPEVLTFNTRLYNLIEQVDKETQILVNNQFSEYDQNTRTILYRLFTLRSDIDVLYARENNLKLARADLQHKINLIPEFDASLDQIEREITAARDLRDKFRDQQESSQISQALVRESKYKVIEPAKVPLAPFKPDRTKIIVLGVLLGLAIGAGAALLSEIMDSSFKNLEEVEETLGIPVIGVIPEIRMLKKLPSHRVPVAAGK